MIVVPLLHRGIPIGVLKVLSPEVAGFDEGDIETLELLAGFIAASLSHASAYQDESRKALHDGLTGLPNRTLLADRLDGALARARQEAAHVAVAYLDLDGFKALNDRYGHAAGDQLLRFVAAEISGVVRVSDTVARVGGDEFVILSERAEPWWEQSLGERVRAAVEAAARSMPFEAAVTASLGWAWSDGHDTPEAVLASADASMYAAKRLLHYR
jgi:diguanylate cyclase (GGDEF)-like protein